MQRDHHVRPQEGDSHVRVKERGLQRNQPSDTDLGLLASRSMRKGICGQIPRGAPSRRPEQTDPVF